MATKAAGEKLSDVKTTSTLAKTSAPATKAPAAKAPTTKAKTTAAKAPAATKAKPKPAAKKAKKNSPSTEFTLNAPNANEVYLVGDFNNWDGAEFRMRKFKEGVHKKSVKLKPGRYEYRFVVDGEWWCDPENPNRQVNSFGSENSVIEVRE